MTETKNWYRSKTVWGGLVALAGGLAGLFGIEAASAEANETAVAALTEAATAIGALIAIFGRFKADRPLA